MEPPRKLLKRQEVDGTARFLTFSCYQRLALFADPAIAAEFVRRLSCAIQRHPVSILAWVVMPEHVHLVVFPEAPEATSKFLIAIKRSFARDAIAMLRASEPAMVRRITDDRGGVHFWQPGGGYDRNVIGEECVEKIGYCHANPIARGLVYRSIDYPFSSARAYEQLPYVGPPIRHDFVPRSSRALT